MDMKQSCQNQKKSPAGYRLHTLQDNGIRGAYSAEQQRPGLREDTAEAEKEEWERRDDTA